MHKRFGSSFAREAAQGACDVVQLVGAAGLALVLALCLAVPVAAAPVDRLMEVMRFDDMIAVLAEEGRTMATDSPEEDLVAPRAAWEAMLSKLYVEDKMEQAFRAELTQALGSNDITPIITFFETELGENIAELEIKARKALSDDAVLSAANARWADLDPESERAQLIEEYIQANDLIEMNVVGSMNSDIAYYRGLVAASSDAMAMDDIAIMREVWAGAPETRAHISEWVYGFSALAYESLTDSEFAAYIAFGKSKAGQVLNSAMFAAFDRVYSDLARGLGAGSAQLFSNSGGTEL